MLFFLSLSLLSLLLAGIFGLLIALTRAPMFKLLDSPSLFYNFLVGHVTFSITVWLMTFALAFWHYKEGRKGNWTPPVFLLGFFLLSLSCLLPYGQPYLSNYIPIIDSPPFYIGLFLFFLGFSFEAFLRLRKAIKNLPFQETPSQTLSLSVVVGLLTLLSLMISILTVKGEGRFYFERLFWIPGHLQQFMYTALMLAVWHELLKVNSGKYTSSLSMNMANMFLLLSSLPLFYGYFTDMLSEGFRFLVALSFGIGLGVPVLVHTFYLIKAIRLNKDVSTFSLLFSMSVYYMGILIAYGGMQSDLRIPAHYHGAVSGVTIAFMGMAYYMLKERLGSVSLERVARLQPIIFGLGINLLVIGFYIAGLLGAPRKTYGFEFSQEAEVLLALNLMGMGSLLAVLGGLMFLLYCIVSLLRVYKHAKAP
ncbi:MAG: cbb3-type cytochrome c oxidase subunit I [Aquificaceae bacterium]